MPSKVLNTEYRGKDGGLIKMMKDAGASADTLKKKMKELQEVGKKPDEGGGVVKDLKSALGARSTLGQLVKIAAGKGAIAGLTGAASEVGAASARVKELNDQFANGKVSIGEYRQGLIEAIPVVGQFWESGLKIKDVLASFDGVANSGFGKLIGLDDLNYAQKINRELESTKAITDYIEGGLQKQKALLKEIAADHTRSAQELGKQGRKGDDLKIYELKIQQENRLTDVQRKRTDALDEADKRSGEALKKLRDKGGSPKEVQHAEQEIEKRASQEKSRINDAFNREILDANALNNVEQLHAEIEHQDKIADFKQQSAKEIQDIQAEANARSLREAGDSLGAELLLIRKGAQDKKDAILQSLKEQQKGASQTDQDTFNKAATDKIAAVDLDAQEQVALARKHQQVEAVKLLQEGQLDILRRQADSGDQNAAAELKRLEAAKALNDEQQKLLDLLKQQLTPAERAAALAQLAALKETDHAGVVKQLADQQADALKLQADTGTAEQQREAKKQLALLDLKKAFNNETARTAAILKDQNATAADKAQAIANFKAFTSTLGGQYDRDLGNDNQPLKKIADLQERGLLITGVAAAARAKKDPSETVATNTKEANQLQKTFNDAFDQWVAWMKQQQQSNPTIVFGVSDTPQ